MPIDHLARLTKESGYGVPLLTAQAWHTLTLIMHEYSVRVNSSTLPPGIARTTAEKMFALFLLLRPDLDGKAYERIYDTYGPVTRALWSKLNRHYISDHLVDIAEVLAPPYLKYEDDRFLTNVTSSDKAKWKARKHLDENLEDEAAHFGWCLSCLTSTQIVDLTIATNTDVVIEGIRTDLLWGTENLKLIKVALPDDPKELDSKIQGAAKWFQAGVNKAEVFESKLVYIQKKLQEQLEAAERVRVPQIETLTNLIKLIHYDFENELYRKLKHNVTTLRHFCSLGRHILEVSPIISGSEGCAAGSECEWPEKLATHLVNVENDGLFGILSDDPQYLSDSHSKWCDENSSHDGDIVSFWTSYRDYASRLMRWLDTENLTS